MSTLVSHEQRSSEPHGARILVLGPNGVGKTSLAKTLDPNETLVADIEHGTLSIADFPATHIRLETWAEVQDLIVRIAGPNRSFQPQVAFSQAHFDRVGGSLPGVENYRNVFLDTITAMSRLSFRSASQKPENRSDRTGQLDLRSVYGDHAREFILALHHLQSARTKNVILIGVLEDDTDELGRRVGYKLQAEGQRVPREIAGIVDVVLTMAFINFGDDKPVRALVCTSPNPWGFPAKDRSGKLDQIEKPDLGALIRKILPPHANHGETHGATELVPGTAVRRRKES